MAFPASPTNNQVVTVNNIAYIYSTANNAWTRTVGGNIVIGNGTVTSTSTTTGALVVQGGTGITGDLRVGGNIYTANLIASSTSQLTITDPMVYLVSNTLYPWNYDTGLFSDSIGGPANVYAHHGAVRNYSTGTWTFFSNVQSEPAATINWSDAGIIYDAVKAGSLTVSNTTTSTSTTTGALVVSGGAGIAGNLRIGGQTQHGTGTFLKGSATAQGEVNFDNGTTDSPGVNFYYANNQNFGIDAASSTLRFVANINESNSTVLGSFNNLGVFTVGIQNQTVAIANGGTTGTGNIGATGAAFNTVFAKATTAQYADLAEIYESDRVYEPGTVVIFGGTKEITSTNKTHDTRVAGVISTNPAYLMNSEAKGMPVAFTGRVPCKVHGPVTKGDVLVTSAYTEYAERINKNLYQPGCILGKSLGEVADNEFAIIEVVVGRF
jgi:hypothetical protein